MADYYLVNLFYYTYDCYKYCYVNHAILRNTFRPLKSFHSLVSSSSSSINRKTHHCCSINICKLVEPCIFTFTIFSFIHWVLFLFCHKLMCYFQHPVISVQVVRRFFPNGVNPDLKYRNSEVPIIPSGS
jgi:hypothetical protein